MIDEQESPFIISRKGPKILEDLMQKNKDWSVYLPFLKKILAIRILQKCRNYYKSLKLEKLESLLTGIC